MANQSTPWHPLAFILTYFCIIHHISVIYLDIMNLNSIEPFLNSIEPVVRRTSSIKKIGPEYKGFCSTIRRYVSPSIILEIISQIFDLTYLDIPFLHRWYGQSNIQESKYLIKGNLFYALFYISISVVFIIIFISMLSKKGKCINAKYVYLLLGPLPVLNILEYFYRLVCL